MPQKESGILSSLRDLDESSLFTSKIVIWMQILIWPTFAAIFLKLFPDSVDSIVLRFMFISPLLICVFLLQQSKRAQSYSQFFVSCGFLLIFANLFYLLYANHLSTNYAVGFFVVVSVAMALQYHARLLFLSSAVAVIGAFVLALLTPEPQMNPWLFLAFTIVESVLAAVVNTQKIKALAQIAEQRRHLSEAENLASIGALASGMAHEINNPLTVVRSKSARVIAGLEKTEIDKELCLRDLNLIKSAATRITGIVQSMTALSNDFKASDNQSHCTPADALMRAKSLMQGRLESAQAEIQSKGDFSIRVPMGLSLMTQTFFALISNALDSSKPDQKCRIELEIDGDPSTGLSIRVRDWGHGVAAEISDKIFLPFFTTRDSGKAVGMGLSMARSGLSRFGARLELTRNQEPTEFTVWITGQK